MPTLATQSAPDPLLELFRRTRALTSDLAAPLSDADATLQAFPDASPAKWHLAHTTWFFEIFVLRDHLPQYRLFDARWPFLLNSYYEGEGDRIARHARGLLSRPSLDQVRTYRAHVDEAVEAALPNLGEGARDLVELGCRHEMQHQELFLTDILAAFAANPLAPAYMPPHVASAQAGASGHAGGHVVPSATEPPACAGATHGPAAEWIDCPGGLRMIGAATDGFAFDAERPRHRVYLESYRLRARTVSNAEWEAFIADGGYRTPGLWLSDGWTWVQRENVTAPLYWRDGVQFTLAGPQPRHDDAPVCHISYYEADAFARWAGARLPTEAEWEAAAPLKADKANLLDAPHAVQPRPPEPGPGPRAMFGDVWEWTASAFLPYPGFRPAPGAVGEYNGKFMSGQMVLRGGSCATPRAGVSAPARNFFAPHARWQFSGVRLAHGP